MPEQARKLSEIMKERSETLLRNPGGVPSPEAAHVTLFFANVVRRSKTISDALTLGWLDLFERKAKALQR